MVYPFHLPQALSYNQALKLGGQSWFSKPLSSRPGDIAVLQYTGGIAGLAKGAMLTHRNLISNVLQTSSVRSQLGDDGQPLTKASGDNMIAPLPLYYTCAFTVLTLCPLLSWVGTVF